MGHFTHLMNKCWPNISLLQWVSVLDHDCFVTQVHYKIVGVRIK